MASLGHSGRQAPHEIQLSAISVLAYKTVRMHSTQAATGLLYVALLMILFGEAFARFLFLNLGILI